MEISSEHRRFTRVEMALPVQVQQGGKVWNQRLIDISLRGVATDEPEPWDARYDRPFTLVIDLDEDNTLVLHARMQYVEGGRLGFSVEHVDPQDIKPLRAVMAAHLDMFQLEEELDRL